MIVGSEKSDKYAHVKRLKRAVKRVLAFKEGVVLQKDKTTGRLRDVTVLCEHSLRILAWWDSWMRLEGPAAASCRGLQ